MDVVFFSIFFMEFILLKIVNDILHIKRKTIYLVIAAMACSIMECATYLFQFPVGVKLFFLYCMIPCIEVFIAFHGVSAKQYGLIFLSLLLISFVLGGVLDFVESRSSIARKYGFSMVTLGFTIYFLFLFFKLFFERIRDMRKINEQLYEVHIQFDQWVWHLRGIVDTGNSLQEPVRGLPVCIMEENEDIEKIVEQIWEKWPQKYCVIPFHSVGQKNGYLHGFYPDEMKIVCEKKEMNEKNSLVAIGIYDGKLSSNNDYQMLLHPKLINWEN